MVWLAIFGPFWKNGHYVGLSLDESIGKRTGVAIENGRNCKIYFRTEDRAECEIVSDSIEKRTDRISEGGVVG